MISKYAIVAIVAHEHPGVSRPYPKPVEHTVSVQVSTFAHFNQSLKSTCPTLRLVVRQTTTRNPGASKRIAGMLTT